jgi:hypothetical protein
VHIKWIINSIYTKWFVCNLAFQKEGSFSLTTPIPWYTSLIS